MYYEHTCLYIIVIKVESGSDGLDYLGHFLVGQVGLIRKLNYLGVTQVFNRSHDFLEKDIGIW